MKKVIRLTKLEAVILNYVGEIAIASVPKHKDDSLWLSAFSSEIAGGYYLKHFTELQTKPWRNK